MGQRTKRWVGVVVLLGLAAAVAWWAARPVPVRVLTLEEQLVQTSVVVAGRVAAARETTLASTLTGRVIATPVAEGAAVEAGAVLVVLESDEWQAALAQAQAQWADARSLLADAQRQLARQRELRQQGFISAAALEAAQRAVDAAEQRVAQAEAAVQQARARLRQASVRAPTGGVVLARLVEVGDGVTPGKPLLRLALSGPPRIVLDLDERDVSQLAEGQPAAIRADAWPDVRLRARVQRIAAQVDSARGTVQVELALTEPPPVRLLPGMTVSAEIVTGEPRPRLLLPLTAVRDGRVATVVEGRVRWRAVETDPARDGVLPVRAGIDAGARVIDPAPTLAEGTRVEERP
jgi:HlyD family secretion protein